MRRQRIVSVLRDVMSLPTAPFHEQRVQAHVLSEAKRLGVSSRTDRHGNLVLHYRRGRGSSPLGFSAHMDHPGLEIVAGGRREALALWHGAVPAEKMVGRGVRLHAGAGDRPSIRGRILGPVARSRLEENHPFPVSTPAPVRPGDFGHLDLVGFRLGRGRNGDLAYTKSADDLGGCAAILLLFEELVATRATAEVYGLFTRAEEVGFFGALGAGRDRTVPRSVPVIVLETSKALPGAAIGKGPVIRLGDRARIFDDDLLVLMRRVAMDRARRDRRFAYQMRVMDGGTCEASPFSLFGYRAAGIALPLGNYHNTAPRSVGAEYISVTDVVNGVKLMTELATRAREFDDLRAEQRKAILGDLSKKLRRLQ